MTGVMIEFNGRIDPKLLVKAHRLQMARFVPFVIIWILCALYFLVSARLSDPATWGVPLFFLLIAVFLLITPNLAAWKERKTNASLQSPISGHADEERFVYDSEFAHVDIPWTKMHRASIRPELILLYPSAGQAFILGRQFFASDESWEAFRRIVAAQVRPVPQGRRPIRVVLIWLAIIVVVFVIWKLTQ
ncbi:MAG: YcxB family protein [Thermoanaerobaculia bacterium]